MSTVNPKDLPTFSYRCELGHVLAGSAPIERCLVHVLGQPCPGVLTRVGKGSKVPAQ